VSPRIADSSKEAAADAGSGEGATTKRHPSLRELLVAHERSILISTLDATEWNISEAARVLGLTRVGLHRKLAALGIRRPT
jgi:transcriptional regulator of acetoin/glycerol metabolism